MRSPQSPHRTDAQPSGGSSGGRSRTYSSPQVAELLFNAKYYAHTYADLRQVFSYNASALKNHWNTCGQNEGRTASPIFDAKWYLAHNPDVARAYADPLDRIAHYVSRVQYGSERRTCI